ncbi:hypothetical protein DRQ53_02935 [bacterium]|nr:MAG: hypothetical protein DRQ32_05120 [bacterium]RKZ17611.1 MAG: hypothetical protein DRQ53_02935 [bacterium]
MRQILAFAAVLLIIPALVLTFQMQNARTGIGTRAGYLDINQPRTLSSTDPALRDPGIPVLCYHYISPRPGPLYVLRVAAAVILNLPTLGEKHFWSLPVGMFEAHLKWLHENGYTTLNAQQVADVMYGRMEAPEKAVCITFDDGERSLLDLGLPLLEKYDMQATLFVVTAHVGQDWKSLDMLDWDELALLQSSGRVSIEAHTHDMHYKVKTKNSGMEPVHRYWAPDEESRGNAAKVASDLRRCRDAIRQNLQLESRMLAWPYGFGNRRLDELARDAGFEATFSLSPGAARPELDTPWHIRRFTITARTTVSLLEQMVGSDIVGDDGLDQARID